MSCQTCLKKGFANDLQIPRFLSACLFIFAPVAELKTEHAMKWRNSHESRPYKDLINCLNKLTGRQISERDFSNEWFHYKRKETSKHLFFSGMCGSIKHSALFFPACITYLPTLKLIWQVWFFSFLARLVLWWLSGVHLTIEKALVSSPNTVISLFTPFSKSLVKLLISLSCSQPWSLGEPTADSSPPWRPILFPVL